MRSKTFLSLVASIALICTHCAPSSSRHSSVVRKAPLTPQQQAALQAQKQNAPNPNATPSGSACAKTPSKASDAPTLLKTVTDAIGGQSAIPLSQLQPGTYTLSQVLSNFDQQNNDGTSYEMVQQFNIQTSVQGQGASVTPQCASNQYAGKTPISPGDSGQSLSIDSSFKVDATKAIKPLSKVDINQRANTGANGLSNIYASGQVQSDTASILSQVNSGLTPSQYGAYPVPMNLAKAGQSITVYVMFKQIQANSLLVYLDIPLNNSGNPHRQILLTYSMQADQTPAAQPSAQPTPQPSAGPASGSLPAATPLTEPDLPN